MASVSFKRGLQANLPSSNIVDGAFYLTTDTNRLYVGGANNKLELLNQSIKFYTYDEVFRENSTVPKVEGQFYYLSDKNILCTFAKTNAKPDGEWVQINPDTNQDTDTRIESITANKNITKSNNDQLVYDINITSHEWNALSNKDTEKSHSATGQLTISQNDLTSIVTNVSVGVAATETIEKDGLVLSAEGSGANSDQNVTIKGSGSVSVKKDTVNDNIFVIGATDTKYDLEAPVSNNISTIKLKPQGGGSEDVVSIEGVDQIEIATREINSIKIGHKDSGVTAQEYEATFKSGALTVPQFTVDSQGHISNAKSTQLDIPDTVHTYQFGSNTGAVDESGNIQLTLKHQQNGSDKENEEATIPAASIGFTADIYDDAENGHNLKTINNQGSLGEIYSKKAVDALIVKAKADMDAMTYKGVLTQDQFPDGLGGIQTGDTYKAAESFIYTPPGTQINISIDAGDLVIYKGADKGENEAPAYTDFDIIPSGDEIDTQYALRADVANSNIILHNLTADKDGEPIQISDGLKVSSVDVAQPDGSNKAVFSIGHTNTIAAGSSLDDAQTPQAEGTFKIPVVVYDAQGHITNVHTNTVQLPKYENNNTTYKLTTSDDNTALALWSNASEQDLISLIGDEYITITTSADDKKIKFAHTTKDLLDDSVAYGPSEDSNLGFNGSFSVPVVQVDKAGHVTSIGAHELTLPTEQVIDYTLSSTLENNVLKFNQALKINTKERNSFNYSLTSSNLTISISNKSTLDTGVIYSIDLVWDDFT